MRIDIATLFVEMCETVLNESIVGRARREGKVNLFCHNIRDYTEDKHRRVDDTPYGGGMGMVMQAEPIYNCYNAVTKDREIKPLVIYMSPKGVPLKQSIICELSKVRDLFIICGHYEGVDQRIIDLIVDIEVSIGDYVLTGGELPALVLVDSIVRLLPEVLSSEDCFKDESHYNGMLEYPQYTRPEVWNGKSVPEVLLSGHHANIEKWRIEKSIELTKLKRPDLLKEK